MVVGNVRSFVFCGGVEVERGYFRLGGRRRVLGSIKRTGVRG